MTDAASRANQLLNTGQSFQAAGQIAQARACFEEALRLDPRNATALHLVGVTHYLSGNHKAAIRFIERAIERQPQAARMYVHLGAAHREAGHAIKATRAYKMALSLDESLFDAHLNLGHVLHDSGDYAAAINAYRRSLDHRPDNPDALLALGTAYKSSGDLDAALQAYDETLSLRPDATDALLNAAAVLREKSQFHAAAALVERAVSLAPENADNRLALASAQLQLGNFEDGWRNLEARYTAGAENLPRRPTPPPRWTGDDLSQKHILITTEQGPGDEILYASMFAEVIEHAHQSTILCSPRMAPAFTRSFPQASVTADQTFMAADLQVAAPSLGTYLRRTFSAFPKHAGYLKSDPATTHRLRHRYRVPGRRLVGIAWQSTGRFVSASKTIPLAELRPILGVSDTTFVSLQYGDCRAEISAAQAQCGTHIIHDPEIDPLKDMESYLAQVAAMDLVITISSTAAHAAAAQNIPTWVLLPSGKGVLWYWFLKRTDSPWYPSARLFRQDPAAAGPWWRGPIDAAAASLASWQPGTA
jgi:tetratricopeptide (TPR) repeat protein